MGYAKEIERRLTKLRADIEYNEEEIREIQEKEKAEITKLRRENQEAEIKIRALESLQIWCNGGKRKVPRAKKTPAPPQLVSVPPSTGHPMSLKTVFQLNRTSYLSFEKIISAYKMVIEGREGLTYPELTEAINATIPDKEKHLLPQRVRGKIVCTLKSPYPEISELFSVTGTRPNTLVHLNLEAVERFQKAS